jgi:putative ABC transport system permease protein
MKYLPLLWSGIWRKPIRTVLVILQIAVCYALFGSLQGMKTGVDRAIADARGDLLLVHSRVSTADRLTLAQLGPIQSVPGVKLVTVADGFGATYQKPTQQLGVVAFNPDKQWPSAYPNFRLTAEHLDAFIKTRTGALVSTDLVRKYGWKVGDRIPLNSTMPQMDGSTDWAFDVVGTFYYDGIDSPSDYIVINFDYFNEARQSGRGTVGRFNVVVSDPTRAGVVADEIDRRFANSAHETRTESLREQAQSQMQAIGDLNFLIRSIVAAVLAALLFATATMMMQSIRERTPELAVLLTVGFTDREVFFLILTEAIVVCVVAAALGLSMAMLVFPFAARIVPGVAMPKIVIVIGLSSALVVALICSAWPALRASRLEVVNALAGR